MIKVVTIMFNIHFKKHLINNMQNLPHIKYQIKIIGTQPFH